MCLIFKSYIQDALFQKDQFRSKKKQKQKKNWLFKYAKTQDIKSRSEHK